MVYVLYTAQDQSSALPSAEVGALAAYPGVLVPVYRGRVPGPDQTARFQPWRPVDEPISHSGKHIFKMVHRLWPYERGVLFGMRSLAMRVKVRGCAGMRTMLRVRANF